MSAALRAIRQLKRQFERVRPLIMERRGLLVRDERHREDPVLFAREALGWEPDEWQSKVLGSEASRMLLNCSRQSGKSTTTAVRALHTALFDPGAVILLISPTLRQSSELFRKVAAFRRSLSPRPVLVEDNALSCTFANESRIVALPGDGDTIRGFSAPRLVIEDEAAYVGDPVYRALRPMLATGGGQLILMSTPNGKRGHFYEAWSSDQTWQRVEVTAEQCPRISEEFLAEELKALGRDFYEQDYGCKFTDAIDQLFRSSDIEAAMSAEVRPLFGGGPLPTFDKAIKPLFPKPLPESVAA